MKLNLKSILLGVAISTLGATSAWSQPSHDGHAMHGLVIFGEQQQFIYHLARYHSPHSFFGVAEGELLNDDGTRALLPKPQKGIYSVLSTEQTVITDLFRQSDKGFQVEVFDGYLRSSDKVSLGKKFSYRITKTHANQLIAPDSPRPSYKKFIVLKENENWAYLVHWLSGAPNYEQILRVYSQDADDIVTGDVGLIWQTGDTLPPFRKFETGELIVRFPPEPTVGLNFDVIDIMMEEHKTLQNP